MRSPSPAQAQSAAIVTSRAMLRASCGIDASGEATGANLLPQRPEQALDLVLAYPL
jgi:hypothetical protein